MDTKVVNIPFVGGINEFNDPDQLQPPELVACEEAVVRQPGRIEKRHGFTLVEGPLGQPAQAFGGSNFALGSKPETMEAYYGQNGSRPVLAAGSKFYEFVGSDAGHGWREVNRLPTYVGSLVSVTASGGSMIEVEAIENKAGTHRLTAWTSGQRTGQGRTSDLAYGEQTAGAGNGIYYSLQLIETGAFIIPPTVLQMSNVSTGATVFNLRVCRLEDDIGGWNAIVTWQEYIDDGADALKIKYALIEIATGDILAQDTLVTGFAQHCHRAYDIVGVSSLVKPYHVVVMFSGVDSASDISPAKLTAQSYFIDGAGGPGAAVLIDTIADVIDHTSLTPTWWDPWAHRGVILDQTLNTDPYQPTIAFGARVISTRYVTAEGSKINTKVLDGQLVLGRLHVDPATGKLATSSHQQSYVQNIGFQTADNHTKIFATGIGSTYYSGSITLTNNGATVGTSLPYPPVTAPGDVLSSPVMMGYVNSSLQPYKLAFIQFGGFYPTAPYTAYDQQTLANSNWYPKTAHTYRNDQAEQVVSYTGKQVNWVNLTSSHGFTDGIYKNCNVYKAGAELLCTASVVVVGGHITEFAIENGVSSVAVGFGSVAITSITGGVALVGGGNIGAGVVTGTAYSLFPTASIWPEFKDIPDRLTQVSNPAYVMALDPQNCVHRWSVMQFTGGDGITQVAAALTSTAANTFTNPNGAEPYGAASPHYPSNFFDVYRWYPTIHPGLYCLNTTGISSNVIASLGGPWRLVAGLQQFEETGSSGFIIGCAISPSGDDGQRSTFLVRIGSTSHTVSVYTPSSESTAGAEAFLYENNQGMFVESANMMRVTSVPLNTPNLHKTNRGLLAAAFRDGIARGTQQIFAIDYEDTPQNWRRMQVFSDYTFINGGVPSVFDGVGVNEAVPLMWPQRDLTSINYELSPFVYDVNEQNSIKNKALSGQYDTMPCAFFTHYASNSGPGTAHFPGPPAFLLINITRPYFKYEAGFLNPNGYAPQASGGLVAETLGNAWRKIRTSWGGDPSKNYEVVYADPRFSQMSATGRSKYNSGFNQGDSLKQHYYGRYHANPADYSSDTHESFCYSPIDYTALWVWAPRSAQGWGGDEIKYPDGTAIDNFGAKSLYSPSDAGGDFLMRWTYEYVDGTGRIMRSCPSNAVQFTVCAEIIGGYKQDSATGDNAPGSYGGVVSVFKYGFFVPRLELTNRLKVADDDPRRVVLQPYTTAEPFSTVLYRMPITSFVNPASDFVVNRNVTRGVVPYTSTAVAGPDAEGYPLGFVTDNLSVFDGPTKDYNGLLSEPYLYTTGGVLDNVPPPAAKAMCMHQNRLVLGGADDQTVVWYSKPITPTDSVAFNDALTITIGDGGPVMGLASLNGNLIVFKYADIYVVPGTFPDATGYGPSLGEPFNLPAGVGCIDHRSVCETPIGVFFRSTRGLELLTPQLDVVPMTKVRSTIDLYPNVTSVIHYPTNREVWFMCHDSLVSSLHAHPSAVMLVYNYQTETWSTFKSPTQVDRLGRGMFAMCLVTETAWMAGASDSTFGQNTVFAYTYDTSVYYDTSRDSTKRYIPVTVKTAPISLNNVQGFQRIKRVRLLANPTPPDGTASEYGAVNVGLATDYVAGGTQSASWTKTQLDSVLTAQGRFQLEVHVAEQKGQRLQLTYSETAPVGGVAASGFGFALSNIALVVGLKAGLDKRILPEAKH